MIIRVLTFFLVLCLLPSGVNAQSTSSDVFSAGKSFAPVSFNSGSKKKKKYGIQKQKSYREPNPFEVDEVEPKKEVTDEKTTAKSYRPKRQRIVTEENIIKPVENNIYHVQRVAPPRKKLVNSPTDESFLLLDLTRLTASPEIKTTLGRVFEVKIVEDKGTKWNFDYDDIMISYFEEEKIRNHLSLFFYAANLGETEIFLDLVKTNSRNSGELVKKIRLKVITTEKY